MTKPFRSFLFSVLVLAFSASAAPLFAQLSTLVLTPSTATLGPSKSLTMTVSIPSTRTSNLTINLSSNNPSVATVPASVIITAGTLSKSFLLSTGTVGGQSTITASNVGYNPDTSLITVEFLILSGSFQRAPGAPASSIAVTTNVTVPAGGPGKTVNLNSSNTSVATVPASVVIPAGARTASFLMNTGSNPGISTITASSTNTVSDTATAIVQGVFLSPSVLVLSPNGSNNMTATINFTGVPTTINLASSDTTIAMVPATVVVAKGATSMDFPVTVGAKAGSATITASGPGIAPDTATVTVAGFTLTPPTMTLGANGTGNMTVTSNFSAGRVPFPVNLTSSNTNAATVPASVSIPAGGRSAVFAVQAGSSGGMTTITASNPNVVPGTADVTVTPQPSLTLTKDFTVVHNTNGIMTVTSSQIAPTSLSVTLTSSNPNLLSVPPSVVIQAGLKSVSFSVTGGSGSGSATVSASASGYTPDSVTITVTAGVNAKIIGSSFPEAILQLPDGSGSTSYVLTNLGPDATDLVLNGTDTFFTQIPTSLHLDKGASKLINVQTGPLAPGFYKGFSVPTGPGVKAGFRIPIRVLVGTPPTSGKPLPLPNSNRADVAGIGVQTTAFDFTNSGDGPVTGILTSDVAWMSPEDGIVALDPGETKTINFTIDRSLREDPQGSDQCSLTLTFFDNPSASKSDGNVIHSGPPIATSLVTIVDTSKPSTQSTSLPPINSGEIVLFVPGVGHILGSGGKLFLSDLSVTNKNIINPLNDLTFFYKPADNNLPASKTTNTVDPAGSLKLGDLVKTVYGQDNQVGTMQIRTTSASTLSVGANVFNANNPKGTYGTTIPVFRSDRAAASGEKLVLTGLRKDSTSHTNLYIQEGSGANANVQIDFLNANGGVVSTLSNQSVSTFGLLQLNNAVPDGAVTAVITNTSGGKVFAFATPVDDASGDTWAVADWTKQFAKSASDSFVIPVVGTSKGANNTFFRTDIAITNGGAVQASATLRYFPRGAAMIQKQTTISARGSQVLNDVVGGLFGVVGDSVGFVIVVPSAGSDLFVTSRTYTSILGQNGTFGTAVPALPAASALRVGSSRIIGGLEDANVSRVVKASPSTFRTNFGMVETAGASATVRVSVSFSSGLQLSGGGTQATKDYTLAPNDFMLISGMVKSLLGDTRDSLFGDLHDVQVKFEVISGNGAILPFVSSTDNGTGDTVLRTE